MRVSRASRVLGVRLSNRVIRYPITPNDFNAHSVTTTRISTRRVGTIQHSAAIEQPQHRVAASSSILTSCPWRTSRQGERSRGDTMRRT